MEEESTWFNLMKVLDTFFLVPWNSVLSGSVYKVCKRSCCTCMSGTWYSAFSPDCLQGFEETYNEIVAAGGPVKVCIENM